jgi:hypothetical protein
MQIKALITFEKQTGLVEKMLPPECKKAKISCVLGKILFLQSAGIRLTIKFLEMRSAPQLVFLLIMM